MIKSFYSFLWKSPNNEESNAIKGKNVTKKSYNEHALILKKSWVTNKISCFYWCVSNDRNQFWLSILYDETINMQNTFMFNCSLCAIEARFFCLIFNLSLTNAKIVTNWGKPQYMWQFLYGSIGQAQWAKKLWSRKSSYHMR